MARPRQDPERHGAAGAHAHLAPQPPGEALEAAAVIADAMERHHEAGRRVGALSLERLRFHADGTAEIESPEAAPPEPDPEASSPDSRADVQALGTLLAQLLGGHESAAPRSAPAAARRLVEQSVDPDPEKRPATATVFARRAREARAALAPRDAPAAKPFRARPGRGARRPASAVAAAMLVLGGAGAGAVAWYGHDAGFLQDFHQRTAKAHREAALDNQWQRAQRAYHADELKLAAKAYERFLWLGPDRARRATALRRLIRCYRRRGNTKEEVKAMQRFIAAFPQADAVSQFAERVLMLRTGMIKRGGAVHPLVTEQKLAVDGRTEDWSGMPPLLLDPPNDHREGGSGHDLVAFYAAVVDQRLFLRIDLAGPVGATPPALCLAVVDGATEPDAPPPWDWQLGFHPEADPWKWDLREADAPDEPGSAWRRLTESRYAAGEKSIEVSFPLSAIDRPRQCVLRPYTYRFDPWGPADETKRSVRVSLDDKMPRRWSGSDDRLDYLFEPPPVSQ